MESLFSLRSNPYSSPWSKSHAALLPSVTKANDVPYIKQQTLLDNQQTLLEAGDDMQNMLKAVLSRVTSVPAALVVVLIFMCLVLFASFLVSVSRRRRRGQGRSPTSAGRSQGKVGRGKIKTVVICLPSPSSHASSTPSSF